MFRLFSLGIVLLVILTGQVNLVSVSGTKAVAPGDAHVQPGDQALA